MPLKLWIDFDNSPHVHFFAPIIRELEADGVKVVLTVRAFSQTEELARAYGLKFTTVGEHRTPRTFATRVLATVGRAAALAAHIFKQRPLAAVSHGSRGLTMAAWALGIPSVTIYDYEFVSSAFFSKASAKLMVPDSIPAARLRAQGVDPAKVVAYPGFKEEVYVYDVHPSSAILSDMGLDPARLIISVRPPATWAHYHSPKSELLFQHLVERLRREQNAQVVVLPRTAAQAQAMRRHHGMNQAPFMVLDSAVDALSLMWFSDAVFSGGGTMIREAALLGVPAYSTFAGKPGAADQALEQSRKLTMLREPSEIDALVFQKRPPAAAPNGVARVTRDFIRREIMTFLEQQANLNN
jgi:predicted glycosyltransferase